MDLGKDRFAEKIRKMGENDIYGKISRLLILRLMLASLIFLAGILFEFPEIWNLAIIALSALVAGYDVLLYALFSLIKGKPFNERFLLAVASAAAFAIGEEIDGAAAVLLYQIGSLMRDCARVYLRSSAQERIMELQPDKATLLRAGEELLTSADSINAGDIIIIRSGERAALDCETCQGSALFDMSELTGDTTPKLVDENDSIPSGSLNIKGTVTAKVTAAAGESTAARIIGLFQETSSEMGKTEKLMLKFEKIFTPCAAALALLLALMLPILFDLNFSESIHRAIVFLVIACPSALAISVSQVYFMSRRAVSKMGIIFKNPDIMENAAKIKAVVFDKTGTLTTGGLRIMSVKSGKMEAGLLLKIAAHAVARSNHPIAQTIKSAYGAEILIDLINDYVEYPGKGIVASADGRQIAVGSSGFLKFLGVNLKNDDIGVEMAVFVAIEGQYAGRIIFSDTVREDSAQAVRDLASLDKIRVVMLTEDNAEKSGKFANTIGINEYYSSCTPSDKSSRIDEIKRRLGSSGTLAYIWGGQSGDPIGVNINADVIMSIGGLGSKTDVEAAGIVIVDDKPSKVAMSINMAKHTRNLALKNIVLIMAVKLAIMALGAAGIIGIWPAVFADCGISILAVMSSFHTR